MVVCCHSLGCLGIMTCLHVYLRFTEIMKNITCMLFLTCAEFWAILIVHKLTDSLASSCLHTLQSTLKNPFPLRYQLCVTLVRPPSARYRLTSRDTPQRWALRLIITSPWKTGLCSFTLHGNAALYVSSLWWPSYSMLAHAYRKPFSRWITNARPIGE